MTSAVPELTLRQRLRALPVFPELFPEFNDEEWSDDPSEVFLEWLEWAIRHRTVEPHAAVLASANSQGEVSSRTIILKDVQECGWRFATHMDTRKVQDFAENPQAALTFYWPDLGRQVDIRGVVRWLGDDIAEEDYRQRPLAGTEVDPDWKAFEVVATWVEFWQASPDRDHRRVIYSRQSPDAPFTRAQAPSSM